MDQVIVEDCFRQAILKYGVPEAVFFDNGSNIGRNGWDEPAPKWASGCYSPGHFPRGYRKVERFNRWLTLSLVKPPWKNRNIR
jgi:hypothetical protein